jgi:hypothetical protein
VVVTDTPASYGAAHRQLLPERAPPLEYLNNRRNSLSQPEYRERTINKFSFTR